MTKTNFWNYFSYMKRNMWQRNVTATLKKDVPYLTYHPDINDSTSHVCPKGTRIRIWMVSRFGDIGVNPKLDCNGYLFRMGSDNDYVEDWLEDIHIEDNRPACGMCGSIGVKLIYEYCDTCYKYGV